jgi:putative oxidoreductase
MSPVGTSRGPASPGPSGDPSPPGYLLLETEDRGEITLIRLLVGWVFLAEGIQKFLLPGERGAGRFHEIGLPFPDLLGPLVGSFEIACGLLLLLGLGVRVAVCPLLGIMAGALLTTKLPILSAEGFFAAAHAARTDLAMTVGCVYLLMTGGGRLSLDRRLWLRAREEGEAGSAPGEAPGPQGQGRGTTG